MRVISNKRLVEFANRYPDADLPLQAWRKLMEVNEFQSFGDLRRSFSSVDVVGDKYVFDIRGNHYRLVTFISFSKQLCFIKNVLTHTEYDKGAWK
jgi:mRNA interferase HigB